MWILILMVFHGGVALTTAQFGSEKLCIAAGSAAQEALSASFVCVKQ